ncbi:mucin-2-like [Physella acuta]|uniref:mucin-2-like n=1 Tax=Physella acuta TaxID=109671 RepID=UPI0027DDAA7F|nr:mucin-2-like [Physella acuta]
MCFVVAFVLFFCLVFVILLGGAMKEPSDPVEVLVGKHIDAISRALQASNIQKPLHLAASTSTTFKPKTTADPSTATPSASKKVLKTNTNPSSATTSTSKNTQAQEPTNPTDPSSETGKTTGTGSTKV